MKNLTNENQISSLILYDFKNAIKNLNLYNSIFSYEAFSLGFKLNPKEIYLVIDYEFSGSYLIEILDDKNTALVIKGFKLGKDISNTKIIARNPLITIIEENGLKYFKLIQTNPQDKKLSANSNTLKSSLPYIECPKLNINPNHERNIEKIMNKLIEMHFGNNLSDNHINSLNFNNPNIKSKYHMLNEVIPLNNYNQKVNLNEISSIENNQKTDSQEFIKMQKWKNEIYSILF